MRLIVPLFLLTHISLAQFTYVLHQDVPVVVEGDTLKMPWTGGLNAAQFNTIDLNGDGLEDLALFDRMANRIITFLRVGQSYVYAPEYESFFPAATSGFMLLRDYDCDGRKDLFTKDLLGIKVFRNVTEAGKPLSWKLVQFYSGFQGPKSDVLLTKGFSGKINLQLQSDDLPALVDVDGDGDLDIFNVRFAGASTIEFHKNFSMERYGTCDSLDFERITQTWGDVEECECGEFAFGTSCSTSGGRQKHSGGKALLALNLDNDNDMDILFSEAECTQVFQLTNTGDNENPLVTSATLFPAANPINILPFPATFYEDVDFDGIPDLISSPNIFVREYLYTDLKNSTWFYKNTGSTQLPQFTFQKRNFLQDEMIDVGDNAVPAFFDFDADGDLDMFIGTFINGSRASIFLYENIGTRTEPVFKLFTDNLIGLSFSNFTNIKPQFADINGDARTDLVFTASNQFGGNTNLYYIPNTSPVGLSLSAQQIQSLNFPIFASENVLVAYINDDQLPDLLVGRQNGALQYWENIGSPSNPVFSLADPAFLGFGSSVFRQSPSVSIGDLDDDGKPDLIVGDQTGRITIISDFKNATAGAGIVDFIHNPISNTYSSQNLGGRVWPTVANIFSTNRSAIVVGNGLGGLHILKHDDSTPLAETPQINLYPNPAVTANSPFINISVDRPAIAHVVSITGQEVGGLLLFQGQQLYRYRVDNLSPGIYVLRFYSSGKSYSRRFIVQ
jgi:hypothetical protein